MTSPVADSYTCPLNGVVAAGRNYMPDWLPAHGQLKSIHLNDLSALNPCPGNSCWHSGSAGMNGPWSAWCGGVFAHDYSQFGAMVFWGGGHGGGDSSALYIFDLTTRAWSIIDKTPPTDYLPDLDPVWCDYLYNGDYVVPGLHSYSHAVYIPTDLGGGPKGSWALLYNVYGPDVETGVAGNMQPHAVDLATGTWTRMTTAPESLDLAYGPYGGAFSDTKRGVLWSLPSLGSDRNAKIDLNQSPRTIERVSSFWSPGNSHVTCYVESHDMLIGVHVIPSQEIVVSGYDMASGTPVQYTVTLDTTKSTISGFNVGIDWCAHTGKFYAYEGLGETTVLTLTPPDNWKTGTWVWGEEEMGGESPASVGEISAGMLMGGSPYTKWKYNPRLRCFMWSQGTVARPSTDGITRSGAFQLYRPIGA